MAELTATNGRGDFVISKRTLVPMGMMIAVAGGAYFWGADRSERIAAINANATAIVSIKENMTEIKTDVKSAVRTLNRIEARMPEAGKP